MLEQRHEQADRELTPTEVWFRQRLFVVLGAGPAAFITLVAAVAGIVLGADPGSDVFSIFAPFESRQFQSMLALVVIDLFVLVGWAFAIRSYYHACPTHPTIPRRSTIYWIYGAVSFLILGLAGLVAD